MASVPTNQSREHVHNQRDVEFATPVEVPPDTAVTADLSAGAAGVVGAVVVRTYNVES